MSAITICAPTAIDCSAVAILIGVVEIFLIVFSWTFGITSTYDRITHAIP